VRGYKPRPRAPPSNPTLGSVLQSAPSMGWINLGIYACRMKVNGWTSKVDDVVLSEIETLSNVFVVGIPRLYGAEPSHQNACVGINCSDFTEVDR
jgi:hypothetical protein